MTPAMTYAPAPIVRSPGAVRPARRVASPAAQAVADALRALADVIEQTSDTAYVARPFDRVSGSIGAHVRHAIDHVAALVDSPRPGTIDYDTRRRGTAIERDRAGAAAELRRLGAALASWSIADDAVPVDVSAVVRPEAPRSGALSTAGRELVFVLSHTIHHQAIIALLLASAGQEAPERFGVAPSTPSPQPCAPSV